MITVVWDSIPEGPIRDAARLGWLIQQWEALDPSYHDVVLAILGELGDQPPMRPLEYDGSIGTRMQLRRVLDTLRTSLVFPPDPDDPPPSDHLRIIRPTATPSGDS